MCEVNAIVFPGLGLPVKVVGGCGGWTPKKITFVTVTSEEESKGEEMQRCCGCGDSSK